MAYTYDPSKISEAGKDRMRFELGDTAVTEQTAALSDEEITAVLGMYPGKWKRAKLALVESVCRRFSFEVNTEIGGLSLGLQARAEAWRAMYKELKSEAAGGSGPCVNPASIGGGHYFYAGMHDNREAVDDLVCESRKRV